MNGKWVCGVLTVLLATAAWLGLPGGKLHVAHAGKGEAGTTRAFSDTTLGEVEPESAKVTNRQIEDFNKTLGADVKPGLTAVPFMAKEYHSHNSKSPVVRGLIIAGGILRSSFEPAGRVPAHQQR